jgi:SAM-dependent methyltransferase
MRRLATRVRAGSRPEVRHTANGERTAVDRYWTEHTVAAKKFVRARDSEAFLEWRFEQYPLFRELTGLWGTHDGEVILDYGCGPGNDLTGFAINTGARRIIGFDVSQTALDIAAGRLELHGVTEGRVELLHGGDGDPAIPLEDNSIDHVNCQGVLHHTSDPDAIVAELARVVRPGGTATIMVYNRDSVWFHLYTAYERMVVENAFPGANIHEAFRRNTDGPECPISRSYPPEEFAGLCGAAGLDVDYVGGYLSKHELNVLERSWARAIVDARLAPEHREFLRRLTYDFAGRPMHQGYHAGIGGTYRLRKP